MNTSNTISKMAQAKIVFTQVYADDANLNGKSPRAAFIERVIAELGMTKHGASNYHQNIRNHIINGKGLYEYNKYKAAVKKVTDEKVGVEVAKEQEPVVSYRWMVMVDGVEVQSFESRSKARDHAKAVSGKCVDRNA